MTNNTVEILIKANSAKSASVIQKFSKESQTQLVNAGKASTAGRNNVGQAISGSMSKAQSSIKGLVRRLTSFKTAFAGVFTGPGIRLVHGGLERDL